MPQQGTLPAQNTNSVVPTDQPNSVNELVVKFIGKPSRGVLHSAWLKSSAQLLEGLLNQVEVVTKRFVSMSKFMKAEAYPCDALNKETDGYSIKLKFPSNALASVACKHLVVLDGGKGNIAIDDDTSVPTYKFVKFSNVFERTNINHVQAILAAYTITYDKVKQSPYNETVFYAYVKTDDLLKLAKLPSFYAGVLACDAKQLEARAYLKPRRVAVSVPLKYSFVCQVW